MNLRPLGLPYDFSRCKEFLVAESDTTQICSPARACDPEMSQAASTICDFGCGTIFKITPNGTLTTLYSFCSRSGCSDGQLPASALVSAPAASFTVPPARAGLAMTARSSVWPFCAHVRFAQTSSEADRIHMAD